MAPFHVCDFSEWESIKNLFWFNGNINPPSKEFHDFTTGLTGKLN
jgi:hypothetical protein